MELAWVKEAEREIGDRSLLTFRSNLGPGSFRANLIDFGLVLNRVQAVRQGKV